MDAAPVWSDVCTFDAAAWRGRVDCVVAGFPCQDLSVAGRRAGLDGKRSGLFFEVTRIAADCGAWLLFLENVAGIATATASVVDAEEGELDERAAARVVGELADLGWNAEWLTLSASDVGASHGRARWFCLAWRVDDARSLRADEGIHAGRRAEGAGAAHGRGAGEALADPDSIGRPGSGRLGAPGRPDAQLDIESLADPGRQHVRGHESEPVGGCGDQAGDHAGSAAVADASAAGRGCSPRCDEPGQRRLEEQGQPRRSECGGDAVGRLEVVGGALANASGARPQVCAGGGKDDGALQPSGRAEPAGLHSELPIFAPGPSDPAWPGIITEHPELAPALEPAFRCVVDGLAFDMGDSRAARLKCVGNGVVALCAAAAFVVLARRAGLAG